MRVLMIIIGSVLVVLSGCSLLDASARLPLPNPFPKGQPHVELGEPSPNGFDQPATAPDTSGSTTLGGPRLEGPVLPGNGTDERHEPPGDEQQRSGLTTRNKPSLPWAAAFRSTQRRPIHALRGGTGPRKIMFVGSLHGNEPSAVALVDRLVEDARDNAQRWNGGTVLFVRTPNPDGLAAGTRVNSRGVDLNRNFPTRNFRPNWQRRTGPSPGSETETQAVLRLLYSYRPSRVVHLKTTTDKTGWVLYNRRAAGVVREFASVAELRFGELRQGAIAGSLENYTADILGMEQITIAVPGGRNADVDAVWREYADVLRKAVGATGDSSIVVPVKKREAPAPPVAGSQPPSADNVAANGKPGPAESEAVPQVGYFELPPPPEEANADGR